MLDEREAVMRLVETGRRIDERGLVIGSGGNTSIRTPRAIVIKATGTSFRDGDPGGYVPVDPASGRPLVPGGSPSIEKPMHLACYRARSDVEAIVHCHPPMAIAWAATGENLRAFTPEMALQLGPFVPLLPYAAPGSGELARSVARVMAAGANAAILANHGVVTVGRTLAEAFDRACLLDAATRAAVFARLLGPCFRFLSDEEIEAVREPPCAHGVPAR